MFHNYVNELKSRAVNVPVVLLIFTVVSASLTLTLGNSIGLAITTGPEVFCYSPVPNLLRANSYAVPVIQNSLICFLFPFTGWLADTVIGRRRAIQLSIWCSWLGSLMQLVSLSIQYSTCGLPVNVAKYGLSVVALFFIMFGSATSLSSIPAYGLEQLGEKSNASVRSFIHWFVWGLFIGFGNNYTNFVTKTIQMPVLLLVTAFFVFLFNCITLCLYACYYDQFKPSSSMKKNPYKTVYKVIKYAKENKYPVKRSAFTYWINEGLPTRIDFGKDKYGGPFKEEEVENVKTFWRIFFVLVCLFGFYVPFYTAYFSGVFSIMNSFEGSLTTLNGYGSYVLWVLAEDTIIIIVPVFELVIIPCFPKIEYFIIRPLRGILACYILLLLGLISLFIITTVGYLVTPNKINCLVISPDNVVELSYLYFIIPLFFAGITSGPRFIFTLEFIISQAPSDMSGMLTGSFWLIQAVYIDIGGLLEIPFSANNIDGPGSLSCTFWILIIQIMICIVGIIVFIIVIRRYKARRKDDSYNYREVIEDAYERALQHRDQHSDEYSTEYVLATVMSVNS